MIRIALILAAVGIGLLVGSFLWPAAVSPSMVWSESQAQEHAQPFVNQSMSRQRAA